MGTNEEEVRRGREGSLTGQKGQSTSHTEGLGSPGSNDRSRQRGKSRGPASVQEVRVGAEEVRL